VRIEVQLEVHPTRMELLRLKKRLVMARRGHKLLKDKQDELMRQFMDLIKDIREIRTTVEKTLEQTFQRFLFVSSAMSKAYLEEAVAFPSKTIALNISRRTVMNISVPEMELTVKGEIRCYGFATTSGELDSSLHALDRVLGEMILLAQKENGCSFWVKRSCGPGEGLTHWSTY
jgi:V/A-type H+-transporting ATPase subunit D